MYKKGFLDAETTCNIKSLIYFHFEYIFPALVFLRINVKIDFCKKVRNKSIQSI